MHAAFIARPIAMATKSLARHLHRTPDDSTSSIVADSLRLLLAALDQVEEAGGFWHEAVAPVSKALDEWDERHGGRHADTWAATLFVGT